MFGKPCSWNTTPWLRELMFLSKPPIHTSGSYLSLYMIFDTFPKGLMGIAPELPSLHVCLETLQPFWYSQDHYKFLTAPVLAGQHGQGQSSFVCALAIFRGLMLLRSNIWAVCLAYVARDCFLSLWCLSPILGYIFVCYQLFLHICSC